MSASERADHEAEPLPLETLFHRHADDVFRIVCRLLGPAASSADVDDLVQLVFIAIHRALPRFRGDSAVTTWIYGITTRVTLQHLRSRRRYKAMIERFEHSAIFEPPPGVEETVEQREAFRRVWGALLRMPADRRIVLVLFELEGLSEAEIGGVLEISEEAVRSRVRRARRELEDQLRKMEEVAR